MQSSLTAFVVRGGTAAQQRQLREKAATEAEAKKAAVGALSAVLTEIPMPTPTPSAHPVADAAASEVVEAADPEAAARPLIDPVVKEWFLTTHDVMVQIAW